METLGNEGGIGTPIKTSHLRTTRWGDEATNILQDGGVAFESHGSITPKMPWFWCFCSMTLINIWRFHGEDFHYACKVPSGKLTWQRKMDLLKMYSLLQMGIFYCHVSLLEGIINIHPHLLFWFCWISGLLDFMTFNSSGVYLHSWSRRVCG